MTFRSGGVAASMMAVIVSRRLECGAGRCLGALEVQVASLATADQGDGAGVSGMAWEKAGSCSMGEGGEEEHERTSGAPAMQLRRSRRS